MMLMTKVMQEIYYYCYYFYYDVDLDMEIKEYHHLKLASGPVGLFLHVDADPHSGLDTDADDTIEDFLVAAVAVVVVVLNLKLSRNNYLVSMLLFSSSSW